MIALQNVTVQQGSFELNEINFAMPEGAYSILMGQTGCGKTTFLNLIVVPAGYATIHRLHLGSNERVTGKAGPSVEPTVS